MLQVELTGWDAMVWIEPELKSIIEDAAQLAEAGYPKAAYRDGKEDGQRHVGWNASDERLGSSECYETFISKLSDAVGM